MKKVLLTTMCLFAMMEAGMGLKAQEVSITLIPGWTWISYPSTDTLDFATALGSFTPMAGDVIKSQWGSAIYRNGQWKGTASQFYPGCGYHYKSNRQMPVTLTFNAQQPEPQVIVTTAEPTDITASSAISGGSITTNAYVFAKGICWATHADPTPMDDNHSENGNGDESFTAEMTDLSQNTTYYVRAYAVTQNGIAYGNQQSFITESASGSDHAYVDLGLPSGLLWATCNVGADNPEDYGDYFAWGETQPKNYYDWSTYQYCMGSETTLTKYSVISDYWDWYDYYYHLNFGYCGYIDNLTTLLPEDDAATANWGSDWRLPTEEDIWELLYNTTMTWTQQNGVDGRLFTANNGNSLFLPAAGCRYNSSLEYESSGYYWSSSLDHDDPREALMLNFGSEYNEVSWDLRERVYGLSVRPVRCKNSVINVTANPAESGTLTGGGTYLDHTSCTVSATANENYIFMYWTTEYGEVVSTEATYTFVVNGNRDLVANFAPCVGGHAYVDLGLPSGTLWATCNVGADNPEDYGDYFAWGETFPKDDYDWSTYQYSNGEYYEWGELIHLLTKYCQKSSYGYNGFTDNLTTLLPEDDAAMANWGNGWRMPTEAEFQELLDNTYVTMMTQNGIDGRLFTADNGNSLFLPAAGGYDESGLVAVGSGGSYWSSSLYTNKPSRAWGLLFDMGHFYMNGYSDRNGGQSVRPVRSASQN